MRGAIGFLVVFPEAHSILTFRPLYFSSYPLSQLLSVSAPRPPWIIAHGKRRRNFHFRKSLILHIIINNLFRSLLPILRFEGEAQDTVVAGADQTPTSRPYGLERVVRADTDNNWDTLRSCLRS